MDLQFNLQETALRFDCKFRLVTNQFKNKTDAGSVTGLLENPGNFIHSTSAELLPEFQGISRPLVEIK